MKTRLHWSFGLIVVLALTGCSGSGDKNSTPGYTAADFAKRPPPPGYGPPQAPPAVTSHPK